MTNELNNPLIDKLIKDVASIDTNSDRREKANTVDELVESICLRDKSLVIPVVKQQIQALITEARVDELEKFLVEPGEVIPYNNNTFAEGFRYVVDKLQDRLAKLKENN